MGILIKSYVDFPLFNKWDGNCKAAANDKENR
jgi:hypothetical protein